MLRACVLDFEESWEVYLPLVEFAYNNSHQTTIGMAPYEALYGRRCRSPIYWDGDRQKSYADKRRKDIQFNVGEKVFLKISPTKKISRFGKRGKLRPRYIGPFEILARVGDLAYKLALPPQLASVHNVFHVSMLRKYVHDPSDIINYSGLEINRDLSYEEVLIAVLDRKTHTHTLRNKDINLIKVQWSRHGQNETTWEREDEVMTKYPEFLKRGK
ncbi:hypothetical protein DH2020_018241 [Rehmannia glutinosa]|uniref:Tf2-1-like SH3-like domain-containing protein n=1 Tax=Rehmannia glutinosa TaxID=99300 RepID=A0ABR0WLT0_REHGL